MNQNPVSRRFVIATLTLSIICAISVTAVPQNSDKKPVVFKTPSGFMAAELSGHIGKLLLAPEKPAGMFVAYPKNGQDMAGFTEEMEKTVGDMFLHDAKNLTWNSAPLPAHKGIDGETGNLLTTSDAAMEVQLAFYTRPEGVAYGYFGMRHKKPKGDDAKFMDANGAGIKAFDELVKSISSNPK